MQTELSADLYTLTSFRNLTQHFAFGLRRELSALCAAASRRGL